jgi:lysophospholipase L1-like esterase
MAGEGGWKGPVQTRRQNRAKITGTDSEQEKNRNMSMTKKILGAFLSWGLAGLITLVLFVAAAEVYLRITLPYKPNLSLYEPDLDLGYRLKPILGTDDFGARVDINSQGLRDREFPFEKGPGTLRILAIGDSWTFGAGVEASQAWPKILEERLKGGPVPVEVMNAGVAGYETYNEAAYYRRDLRKFEHDVVLVALYPVNDVQSSPRKYERNKRMYAIHPWLYKFYEFQKRCLYLQHVYQTWRIRRREARLARHYGNPAEADSGRAFISEQQDWTLFYHDNYEGWVWMKKSFRSMGETARECGARGFVILLPDNQDLGRYLARSRPRVAPMIRQAVEEAGLEFLDIGDAFAPFVGREREIALGGVPGATHLNPAGYEIVADAVAHELRARGALDGGAVLIQGTGPRGVPRRTR